MDDMKWFIGFLVVMGILWIGARNKAAHRAAETATTTPKTQTVAAPSRKVSNPNLPKTQPQQTYPPAGTVISNTTLSEPERDVSPLAGKLRIVSVSRGVLDKEYVVIQAAGKNENAVPITGLLLRSGISHVGQIIGEGWPLYFPHLAGGTVGITLPPGARAYLLSGRSPLGTSAFPNQGSFQLNLCTGYFEQGLDFYPKLPLACPQATEDPLPLPPNELSDECYDYLKTLKRCIVPSSVPEKLRTDGSCQAHVFSKINYNQCVSYYKDEPNFYSGEWRVYLGRTTDLWRDSRAERVELLDAGGRLIDSRAFSN